MAEAGRQSMPHSAAQPTEVVGARPLTFGMGQPRAHSAGAPVGQPVQVPYGYSSAAFPQAVYPYAVQQAFPQTAKRKRRRWLVVLILLLCIALAVAAVFLLLGGGGTSKRAGVAGSLEGKTPDEIQAELDRIVEEGMFNISIASVVQMAQGSDEAELRIENSASNRYLMRVDIARDDTGEEIYTTDLIEPGFHIQQDVLDVVLPAGTYPCTAMFSAYDRDTEEQIGQAACRMTIQVAN